MLGGAEDEWAWYWGNPDRAFLEVICSSPTAIPSSKLMLFQQRRDATLVDGFPRNWAVTSLRRAWDVTISPRIVVRL